MERTKIVAFGDSTTAQRETIEKVYAQRIAEQLPKHGVDAEIINAGVPGNTTQMARKRFERDVLSKRPDLVIIQFGINDSAIDVWKDPPQTLPRVPQEIYEQNLRHFAATLLDQGAKVILMTPNSLRWVDGTRESYGKPPYSPDDPVGFNLKLKDYAQAVRDIAAEMRLPLVDVYNAFEQYGSLDNQATDDLMLDGMHPNDNGHRLVAKLLIGEVVRIAKGG